MPPRWRTGGMSPCYNRITAGNTAAVLGVSKLTDPALSHFGHTVSAAAPPTEFCFIGCARVTRSAGFFQSRTNEAGSSPLPTAFFITAMSWQLTNCYTRTKCT